MAENPPPKQIVSSDLSDRTLGDFRLLRRLGVGGMAEVYLAEQTSLKRSVAVKILQEDAVSGKTSLLKRFEQEARAAGGLSHPNIVQVYMIGREGDLHYIVQEYVQGQNLSQWFKRHGPPDFLTGVKWMKQVAAALRAASDAGIVHRDIKPENIMLTRDNDAKVTDFGLAQLNETTEKMNLTQAGTTLGTPWYMSPEQIQGEKLDHRSDQYSFGVTCYHMFAGQPPFPGKNSVSVAVQHLKEEPKPLSHYRRDLPEVLCQVIHRMMAKNPEARFASAEELLQVIEKLEHAPLRPELNDVSTFSSWVRSSMPPLKTLAGGLLMCLVIGFLVGRQLFEPVRLSAGQTAFPREETAARQYARALLLPGNEAAWRAVYQYYPKSSEALWARLQLGVYHLTKSTPDPAAARSAFSELYEQTSLNPSELRDLRFLALLGQARAAEMQGRTAERNEIVETRLATDFQDLLEAEFFSAPDVLQEFRSSLLSN
ncbi:MAG: serine/threonine-protein kinase [Fuerstiella sp.]